MFFLLFRVKIIIRINNDNNIFEKFEKLMKGWLFFSPLLLFWLLNNWEINSINNFLFVSKQQKKKHFFLINVCCCCFLIIQINSPMGIWFWWNCLNVILILIFFFWSSLYETKNSNFFRFVSFLNLPKVNGKNFLFRFSFWL